MITEETFAPRKKYTLKDISFSKDTKDQEVFYLGRNKIRNRGNYHYFVSFSPDRKSATVISFGEDSIITDGDVIEQIHSPNGEMVQCYIRKYTRRSNFKIWKELSDFLEASL